MTTRMQVVVTDDWEEHDGRGLTDIGPDGSRHVISLDGVVVELDLNAKNAAALRADMEPWLAAGHRPGQDPLPSDQLLAGKPRKGQGVRREVPGTRDFYRELREWAAENGLEIPQAGRGDSKRNYVYTRLLPPYLEWLQTEAARGQDGGTAAARLAMAALLGLPGAAPAREDAG